MLPTPTVALNKRNDPVKIWYNNLLDAHRYVADIKGDRVRIGRDASNDIVLNSPFVASTAACLQRQGEQWTLTSTGVNGCEIEGHTIRGDTCHGLENGRRITIFPFELSIDLEHAEKISAAQQHRELDVEMSEFIRKLHISLLALMNLQAADSTRFANNEALLSLERQIDDIALAHELAEPGHVRLASHIAGYGVRGAIVERLIEDAGGDAGRPTPHREHWSRVLTAVPQREDELAHIVNRLMHAMTLTSTTDLSQNMDQLEADFWAEWHNVVSEFFAEFRLYLALRELKKQIKDIVLGYGPLEDLLRIPTISEVMVVDREHIYIEKNGVIENSGRRFISDEVTVTIIERIVARVGRRIDKSQPLVDARLADGSRVNAVIPPIAVSGPCLTVRKFPACPLTIETLISKGTLTRTVAEFLRACVINRRNILISGGTGSGKTTLLNCLSRFIPSKERIVTIEDTTELQLGKEHVVSLETKLANAEGRGEYDMRRLVRNALRMRPDRIVVGECRGAEALDMLQAMNTGHDGCLTTIHANSAHDVVLRLEVLVQLAAQLPVTSIHRQIASAIDVVVHLERGRDGIRRIVEVAEFAGIDEVLHAIRVKQIFVLDEARRGGLSPTGILPSFMQSLIDDELIRLDSFYDDVPENDR